MISPLVKWATTFESSKNVGIYGDSLFKLFNLNEKLYDQTLSNEFKVAIDIFNKSIQKGNILLLINGINQYSLDRKLI